METIGDIVDRLMGPTPLQCLEGQQRLLLCAIKRDSQIPGRSRELLRHQDRLAELKLQIDRYKQTLQRLQGLPEASL